MPPTFSIIIPAYNEENYIRSTLHSLKVQTYQDFEVVVVANGCTDRTEEIVSKRAGEKIRLLSLARPNVSVARNAGALNAQGDILLFLDADTQLAPNSLQMIKDEFAHEGLTIATVKTKPDSDKLKHRLAMGMKNLLLVTGAFKGFSGTFICRKEDFRKVGGYNPEVTIKEHHLLRKKLQAAGMYKCIDSFAITSMRRFNKWSFSKTAFFWMKTWSKHYLNKDIKDIKYENIR